MNNKSILFIDDDQTLLDLLLEHFQHLNYQARCATNGEEGLAQAESNLPDIIVLDVMMPGMDGWTVCKRLREWTDVPIILLTAKGEEIDKLHGFHMGIDDYITKPFSFGELSARVEAILSRVYRNKLATNLINTEDLTINLDQQTVTVADKKIDLSPIEYRLLELLAKHINKTIPLDMILKNVWGSKYIDENEHVKHYIWSLRKKIELDPGDPKHILTERGFGYRLE